MRCVSFCLADNYRLGLIVGFFRSIGYYAKQYRQVIHVTPQNKKSDIFVFSYGCIVTWGLYRKDETKLIEQLKSFSVNPVCAIEVGHFIYKYSDYTEIATHGRLGIDIVKLESDSIQLKLAISYGLAQSIQLESFESSIEKTIEKNSHVP